MLVNPDLWTAFDNAKEALLAAIKTSLFPESPSLSLHHAGRESAKDSRRETIGELDVFTTQLKETMNDLDAACKDVQLRRFHIQTSLSPITILPPELIRYIAKLAVGTPENTRRILNLSHVSVAWREVVTSTSELFTESDWNRWHVELITIWLSRAREQPQKIYLETEVLEALFQFPPLHPDSRTVDYISHLWEKLEQALLTCVHLNIQTDFISMEHGLDADSWCRSWMVPRLERFEISALEIPGTFAVPESSPALRTLNMFNYFPTFSGSSLLTHMKCCPGEEPPWSKYVMMLNSLPSLEYLHLILGNDNFDGVFPLHLPLLHTLELHGWGAVPEPERRELIKSFVVPNITTFLIDLKYQPTELGPEGYDSLWDTIVSLRFSLMYEAPQTNLIFKASTMAGLTSLQILYDSHSPSLSINALSRSKNAYLLLPSLRELSMLGPYQNGIMASVHKVVAEREAGIRTLTVPSALKQENFQLWVSLKSLVPDFRVRDYPSVANKS